MAFRQLMVFLYSSLFAEKHNQVKVRVIYPSINMLIQTIATMKMSLYVSTISEAEFT